MNKFTLMAVAGLLSFNVQAQVDRVLNSQPVNAKPNSEFLKKSSGFLQQNSNNVVKGGASPSMLVSFSDDFSLPNDTDGLKARGYIPYYRGGGPQAAFPTWFQGAAANWNAFNGAVDSYVMANYQIVSGANNIDSWLVLPALNVASGDVISFYSRSVAGSTFADSIRVMYSAVGDSVPEDLSWVQLGNFKVNILGVWELKTFTAPAAGANARFAIRYAVADGGPNGANSNLIGIDQLDVFTPVATDGGVTSVDGLFDACGLSAATPIAITIANNGSAALTSVPVNYSINGGTPVSETFTGNIAPFGTATYTFTQTADLSAVGTTFNISAYTTLGSDANAANDSTTASVSNVSPYDLTVGPVGMGFETTDDITAWSLEDVNADASTWDFAYNPNFSVLANTGDYCFRVASGGTDLNDWLYTKCIDLNATTTYTLSYYTHLFDVAAPGDITASVGNAQNAAAMTQQIVSTSSPIDSWTQTTQNFTVPTSGTYYIGFNANSATTSILRLDDINIDIFVGLNDVSLNNAITIAPNPTTGLVNVSCKANEKVAVAVYNNMGQEVASYNFNSAFKTQIDLSAFANGIYTIRLNSANQSVVNKIILNK